MRKRDAIRSEIRAAQIAADVIDGFDPNWTSHAMAGWVRRGDNREGFWPKLNPVEWHAGWLASVIWENRKE